MFFPEPALANMAVLVLSSMVLEAHNVENRVLAAVANPKETREGLFVLAGVSTSLLNSSFSALYSLCTKDNAETEMLEPEAAVVSDTEECAL
jgi:hypothetical protein